MLDSIFHRHSMEDLFKEYIEQVKIERGLSPKTIQGYGETFSFLKVFLKADKLTLRYWVVDYLRPFFHYGRNERKWAVRTYHIHHNNLKKFGDWLVTTRRIRHNPLLQIQKPKQPEIKLKGLRIEWVHRLQYVALLKSSPIHFLCIRNHAIVNLALQSGLRRGEIINLTIRDILFHEGQIHVRNGKCGKDRFVDMTDDLQSTLHIYLREHERFYKMNTLTLFPSKSGKSLNGREFRRLSDKLSKLAGFSFSWHDLRRTYATNLSIKGVSAFIIKDQLGHSDIRITMRYVAHEEEDRHKVIKGIQLYS